MPHGSREAPEHPSPIHPQPKRGYARIELATSCTQSRNHTSRPIARNRCTPQPPNQHRSHNPRGYGLMARRRIPDPKIGGSNPSSLTFFLATEPTGPTKRDVTGERFELSLPKKLVP